MNGNNGYRTQCRVVDARLGAVSSNGVGLDEFWNATRSGKSGIDTITSFDPESLSCRIAGAVKNFKPEDYLAPRELTVVRRAVALAIAATKESVRVAQVCLCETSLEEKRSWGVVRGSGGGTPDFVE